MALPRFKFVNVASIDEAVDVIREHDGNVQVIGGGTDLLHGFKDDIYKEYPELVVNLRTSEQAYIEEDADCIKVGAVTTVHDIETNPLINAKFAALSEAAYTVASPQIRNASTIAGNICQEPRCWYFRNADNLFECMRKGGDACPAFTGRSDLHSICGAAKVKTTPCQEECPNGTPIPAYFDLIRQGDISGAAKLFLTVSPLAAMTGRVCPHTCQGKCNRYDHDHEVSIRDIEREVGDYILENASEVMPQVQSSTGKKIAVVGAGPAGLTAAYFLRLAGNDVVVFDENDQAGGMLVYGIPAYRLPKDLVAKNVKLIEDLGVKFYQNVKIGSDLTLAELEKEYDAVFLGIGAWTSVSLGCKGEDTAGVIGGIDFLYKIANKEALDVADKVVGVVGGGNTAMDACRSAMRLGAGKVYNFYRRTQSEMPADEIEIIEAAEEGIKFRYLVTPEEIIAKDGKAAQIKLQKMELGAVDSSGRRRPVPIEGEFEIVDVDLVIAAIGQGVDTAGFEAAGTTKKNWIAAGEDYTTKRNGVFAAGDGAQGPETVVKAIAHARKAAAAINEYLGVQAEIEEQPCTDLLSFDKNCIAPSEKMELPVVPASQRTLYDEDVSGLGLEAIQAEASRCFNCGCVAVCPSDLAPALVALDAVIKTTKRTIQAKDFFCAGVHTSTVLDEDELVKEILLPKKGDVRSKYLKFRHRQAIDFPLVGVAAELEFDGDTVADARIALGAVAPVPVRAEAAESLIRGKKITEELAEEAAERALEGALPLKENGYKVQVAKTYVKRAILACSK